MSPRTTLAAYAIVLAAVFGAGLGVGALVGPLDTTPVTQHGDHAPEE